VSTPQWLLLAFAVVRQAVTRRALPHYQHCPSLGTGLVWAPSVRLQLADNWVRERATEWWCATNRGCRGASCTP
jgi:hypothetical protein